MENFTIGFILLGSIIAILAIAIISLQKSAKIYDAKQEQEKEKYRLSAIKKYKKEEMLSEDIFAKEIRHSIETLTSSKLNRLILTQGEQPEAVVLSIVEYESMKELADKYNSRKLER